MKNFDANKDWDPYFWASLIIMQRSDKWVKLLEEADLPEVADPLTKAARDEKARRIALEE